MGREKRMEGGTIEDKILVQDSWWDWGGGGGVVDQSDKKY